MKKVLLIILVILLIFAMAAVAGYGLAWYRSNHIFIEGDAYPLSSTELDLRDKNLTIEDYESIHAQLPYCAITWNVPFQDSFHSSDTTSLTVTSVTAEDLGLIQHYFPNLKELKATGCKEYALLAQFRQAHPECTVTYDVDLGGSTVDPDSTELILSVGQYDYDTLMTNLVHLPQLKAMTLKTPELSLEQVDALKAAYEAVEIHCTVAILGQEYDTGTTELNLSALTSGDVAATAEKLAMLPNLAKVELMDASGSSTLTKAEVKSLMDTAPQVVFNYTFDFFGETLSTASEEVELKNVKIGDENEAEIRLALDLMKNCKRFVLDNCHMSDEVMAQLRDDYREQTKVVWRVWFGKGSSLTDAELLRVVGDLLDSNCSDLIYLEDVVCADLGHNEWLTDTSFIAGMKNLEILVISGAPIKSLEPFRNCKKLKFLEVAFCEYLEDASPLAECESLEMLNISNTHITDLSPLDDLPLTHLCAKLNPVGTSRVSKDEQARFIEKHPDCWSTFDGEQPYGPGWRYDEDGITPLPYYKQMRDWLLLDLYPRTPNHTGWYFETYAHLT